MKNITLKLSALAAVLVISAGCVKETFPHGGAMTENQIDKLEQSTEYMINFLASSMMASETMGYDLPTDFGIGSIHIMTEFMLEDLACMASNTGYLWYSDYAACAYQGSEYVYCSYFWECFYSWIKIANDVISRIDPNSEIESERTILGQAYAYRAYYYLNLARMYEPKKNKYKDVSAVEGLTVPIVTEKTTEKEATNNPRASVEAIYKFIFSDLDKAYDLLKGKSISYTMPSETMVNVLYARAYLERGAAGVEDAYEKAIEYADKVILESGRTPLTASQWHDPVNGFNNGQVNNSWIWGLTCNSAIQRNLGTFIDQMSPEAQWGYSTITDLGINKDLYDQISDKDFRKYSYFDPKGMEFYPYQLAGTPEEQYNRLNGNPALGLMPLKPYQSFKFRPNDGNVTDFTIGNAADLCMMRVEELYFIKAEAQAQLGLLDDASQTLDKLVNTRYEDNSYDSSRKTYDKEVFIDELLLQKRIEFWGEGVLFYDYKRLDRGITRAYSGSNHAADFALNTDGRSPQWNFVITRLEYQSNTGITDATNNPDPSDFIEPTPIM